MPFVNLMLMFNLICEIFKKNSMQLHQSGALYFMINDAS